MAEPKIPVTADDFIKAIEESNKMMSAQIKPMQEGIEKQIKMGNDLIMLINKFLLIESKELSNTDKKEIVGITCFGGLSWCCNKECPKRNIALMLLGIDKNKFAEMKMEFDKLIEA